MKKKTINLLVVLSLIAINFASTVIAQRGPSKTDSRMLYHGGLVMRGASHVYVIHYGCWSCGMQGGGAETQRILGDFVSTLGLSPYFRINSTYPDSTGAPTGALVYAGAVDDMYSHGNELTAADIAAIVADKFSVGILPQDPAGIYVIFATPDVSSIATGFCNPGATPFHGQSVFEGTAYRYAFVGNAMRCPTMAGPQFVAQDGTFLPTPNGDFAGDAMVSITVRALNMIVTNPAGNAWYDRYNLENAEKCQRTYGTTYTTTTGARANLRLAGKDYLVDQNWVNDRKGGCALSYP